MRTTRGSIRSSLKRLEAQREEKAHRKAERAEREERWAEQLARMRKNPRWAEAEQRYFRLQEAQALHTDAGIQAAKDFRDAVFVVDPRDYEREE